MKTKTWSIGAIRMANALAGEYFFSPRAMKFFSSKIFSRVFQGPGGVFFVTSETAPSRDEIPAEAKFTVREFNPSDGGVKTVGEFQSYKFVQDAKAAACLLAGGAVDAAHRGVIQ